jgi:hypothetical protein
MYSELNVANAFHSALTTRNYEEDIETYLCERTLGAQTHARRSE